MGRRSSSSGHHGSIVVLQGMRVNIPILIGIGLSVYWLLEAFLLDGFAPLALFFSSMGIWSLAVSTLSHPGPFAKDPQQQQGGGDGTALTSTSDAPSSSGAMLRGASAVPTAMQMPPSGGGGGRAGAQLLIMGSTPPTGAGGAHSDLELGASRDGVVISPLSDATAGVGDEADFMGPAVAVGHFRPKRVDGEGADDANAAHHHHHRQQYGMAVVNMGAGGGDSDEVAQLMTGSGHANNNSNAPSDGGLVTTAGGLLSLAVTRFNQISDAAGGGRMAGMVTPTLSEASFATTAASTSSKLSKKEKRERKEQKERERMEKRLLKDSRKRDPLFCRSCDVRRPPRTHHCRVCDDCIVRYDHHCVWIDNCIGAANLKAFFLFLSYTCLALLHFFYSSFSFAMSGHLLGTIHGKTMGYFLAFVWVFGAVPMALFAVTVAVPFLVNTAKGILYNYTTYERAMEGLLPPPPPTAASQAASAGNIAPAIAGGGDQQHNPLAASPTPSQFDRGQWTLNARDAFGDRLLYWWIPTLVTDKDRLVGGGGRGGVFGLGVNSALTREQRIAFNSV